MSLKREMKKIMFNDQYGLTHAVLEGRKTQTRRIIKVPRSVHGIPTRGYNLYRTFDGVVSEIIARDEDEFDIEGAYINPAYKVGEVVAIAQAYKEITDEFKAHQCIMLSQTAGWKNKMFVCADLMPHHVHITNVRVERLQDISNEDCIKEGIIEKWHFTANLYYLPNILVRSEDDIYPSPREAYAALIDRISGKGTWQSNPYVFVYDFKFD